MIEQILNITPVMRIHWVYLISTAIMAMLFLKSVKILTVKYVFNSSNRLDLELFLTNRVVKYFLFTPIEVAVIFYLSKKWALGFPDPLINLQMSTVAWMIFFTAVNFIFDDFLRFIQHIFMHKVPFLWEIHKVHHSAHLLTPLTLYRVHFIEVALASVRRILGTFVVVALMMSLGNQFVSGYEIMGVLVTNFFLNLLGGNLRHSHIPIRFGYLEWIFISPAQHQIHHSKSEKHFDKNFGVALSIWDWAFGSLIISEKKQKLKFGLGYKERNHQLDLASTLVSPVVHAFKTLSRNKKNKIVLTKNLFNTNLPAKERKI